MIRKQIQLPNELYKKKSTWTLPKAKALGKKKLTHKELKNIIQDDYQK